MNILPKILACLFLIILLYIAWLTNCHADIIDDIAPFVIEAESGNRPNVVSSAGCIGLMQISDIVLEEWNTDHKDSGEVYIKEDLYYGDTNVAIGKWYLRKIYKHYLKNVGFVYYAGWIYLDNNEPEERHGMIYVGFTNGIDISEFPFIQSTEDYRLALTLAAYNWGINNLRKVSYNITCVPQKTKTYVKQIMTAY